jgi:hypothetical protein
MHIIIYRLESLDILNIKIIFFAIKILHYAISLYSIEIFDIHMIYYIKLVTLYNIL